MKRSFGKLRINNFKTFLGEHELDLSSFADGLHFVKGSNRKEKRLGSNGSGKSSLWDAVTWCYFGKTPSGLRNPDVMPWGKKCKVWVSSEVYYKDKLHVIRRSTNPNSLTLNGKDCGQEHVEAVLGLDFDVFTNTIILGQGRPLFFDLTPTGKMKLFSDVLHLDKWNERSKKASSKVAGLQGQENDLQLKLSSVTAKSEQLGSLISDLKEKEKSWRQQQSSKKTELAAEVKEYDKVIKELSKKKDIAEVEYDVAMTEGKLFDKSIDAADVTYQKLAAKEARYKAKSEIYETQLAKLRKELKELKSSKTCPTCGQPIKQNQTASHESEIRKEISELKKKVGTGVPDVLARKLAKAEKKLEDMRAEIGKLSDKAVRAHDEVDRISYKLSDLKAELSSASKKLEAWEDEENPHTTQLAKLREQKKAVQEEVETLKASLDKVARRIVRAKFWIKGFKDIRLQVIDDVLQELQLVTDSMLDEMGLQDWRVIYAIEKETKSGKVRRGLNVTILSPSNKKPVKWESWSGGEAQRLRVAGALALSDVLLGYAGVQSDLEVLDEPINHMSIEGVEDLCDFLATRAEQMEKKTFYAAQLVMESSKFKSVTKVVKGSKGSSLTISM